MIPWFEAKGKRIKEAYLLWQGGSMPGQKSIRLGKKGGGSSLPKAGFRRYQPGGPSPPRLIAERRQDGHRKVTPGPFYLRRLLFCPGNEKVGAIDH